MKIFLSYLREFYFKIKGLFSKDKKEKKVPAKKSDVKVRNKIVSLDKKKAKAGWLFVLPFVLGFLLVYLPIIYDSIKYSFSSIQIIPGGGYQLKFVGLDNYSNALFVDTNYTTALSNSITGLIVDIPAILMFSLFVAILLNTKIAGRAAFRAIFFIPVILATGLISNIDSSNAVTTYMSSSSIDTGTGTNAVSQIVSAVDIQKLFSNMLVGSEITTYVVNLVNNIFDIVNRSGVQMLIFLAGLQSISPSVYEAAEIEGASAWETFWKITFPSIMNMILVNAVYTVIDAFTSSNNEVMQYISSVYKNSGNGNVKSSAMAWMYFIIVILIVALVGGIISIFVHYQRRDEK